MLTPSDGASSSDQPARTLLTQKEYARHRGWSKQYVNQLVKQGRIQLVNGRIDPATADAVLAGARDPSRGRRLQMPPEATPSPGARAQIGQGSVAGAEGTFVKARTVREHFRAMREKMEFEAASGELVRRRDVEEAAYEIGVMFREHMTRTAEAIGLRVAARFALKEIEVISIMNDEISQALRRLHDAIQGNEWGFDGGLAQVRPATLRSPGPETDHASSSSSAYRTEAD
jgi:hypothetical protein